MANKVRKLSIGKEVKEQFHYIVGGLQRVFIDGESRQIAIHEIEIKETYYAVNMKIGDEVQEWKQVPKNDITTVEFQLD